MSTAFQQKLAEVGDERAAEQLGVKPRTVKSWRRGDRYPKRAFAARIVERWPVSLDDIYRETAQTARDPA